MSYYKLPIEIMPDWQVTWTAEQAEQQLGQFRFNGPGWYMTKTDSILVIPVQMEDVPIKGDDHVWKQKWPADQLFRFLVYNRDPSESFNAVANAPTRQDDR